MLRHLRLALLAAVVLLAVVLGQPGAAQQPNRAAVVVRFGDGSAEAACVEFNESSITGTELLLRAGQQKTRLRAIMQPQPGLGAAVCKIGANGCELSGGNECFCQCQGLDCVYWAYFQKQNDGGWLYSGVGASGREIRNGMMDGWAWGPGSINQSSEVLPPAISFDQVCLPPAATATPTLTLTPTHTPTPTQTLTPAQTATPTNTPTVTPTPTITPTTSGTPPPTATATPTINPALLAIEMNLAPQAVAAGTCATLSWRVSNAESAYLQIGSEAEQSVSLDSALQVCPQVATAYTVRAVAAGVSTSTSRTLAIDANAPTQTPIPVQPQELDEGDYTVTPFPIPTDPLTGQAPPPDEILPPPVPLDEPPVEALIAESPTPAPAIVAAATVGLTSDGQSAAPAQTLRQMTPMPEQARADRPNPGRFLAIGGFALVVAIVLGLGLWAYFRQSG